MKWIFLWLLLTADLLAGSFTAGTFNLELYSDRPVFEQPPKSDFARKIIRQSIRALKADVVALQEVGSTAAFAELCSSLKAEGANYPYTELVHSYDTNLHLAFLSKYPIVNRNHHTNENFLYQGRRFHAARGFGEVEIEFPNNFRCTFMTTHLKSKRLSIEADQQGLREEEAVLLRERIDQFFKRSPRGHLIVLGDLNDGFNSKTVRTVLGRGNYRLYDTRPIEQNGDSWIGEESRYAPRRVIWTHFFGRDETYSRIDYILTSPSLRKKYQPSRSFIPVIPDWGAASDHRPLCATFEF